jgi:hypothetical protein
MTDIDHLEHEFLGIMGTINHDIFKRIHTLDPNGIIKGERFEKLLRNHEKYVLDVFTAAMRIVKTVEQLRYVPIFLRNFPSRKRFDKYKINHPKYLQYHLETHFIKIATLLDQMAILISKVFVLGIPEKKCSVDAILENDHTRNSSAAKVLKTFDKSIQGIKSVRNLLIHRGIFNDEELNDIGMLYFISENRMPGQKELFPEQVIKFKTRFTIKRKLVTILNNNRAIDSFVTDCFHSLTREFKKQYQLLSASDIKNQDRNESHKNIQ